MRSGTENIVRGHRAIWSKSQYQHKQARNSYQTTSFGLENINYGALPCNSCSPLNYLLVDLSFEQNGLTDLKLLPFPRTRAELGFSNWWHLCSARPLDRGLAPARFTIIWNTMHHVIFLFHTLTRVFKSHTVQSWIFKPMLHLRSTMSHPTDVGCSANHSFVFILSYYYRNRSVHTLFGRSCNIRKI